MSKEASVTEVLSQAVAQADSNKATEYSVETLALLINAERLRYLEKKITSQFSELKKRQDQVIFLHKLIKTINLATNSNGEFDCKGNQELIDLLNKAKEFGVQVKDNKTKYTKD